MSFKPWLNAATDDTAAVGEKRARYPTTGIAGCCARAASDHATAAPPNTVINERRFTARSLSAFGRMPFPLAPSTGLRRNLPYPFPRQPECIPGRLERYACLACLGNGPIAIHPASNLLLHFGDHRVCEPFPLFHARCAPYPHLCHQPDVRGI